MILAKIISMIEISLKWLSNIQSDINKNRLQIKPLERAVRLFFIGVKNVPYRSNTELPESVKNNLPEEAQTTWRKIFNSAMEQYKDEGKAAATAWAGLKNAGWEKGKDGEWYKVSKADEFEIFVPVTKLDDEQQIVFGWGSVTKVSGQPVIDSQGDIIEDTELEKAVYDFMVNAVHDEMHKRIVLDSKIVESFVVTDEKLSKMFPGEAIPRGFRGWWIGVKINDPEVYRKHKTGEYTGFSITGKAMRKEV